MTRLFEAKPFIICEVGSNWQTLEHCIESIVAAKECGADAVKFQAFTAEALYGPGVVMSIEHELPVENGQRGWELSWLPDLKDEADRVGIELMCTAFSPELVEAVDPYVTVHKVASSDACYPQLLHAVAKTGKPILISTGAKSTEDVQRLSNFIIENKIRNVVHLSCTANYPADYTDLSGVQYGGLSDHTLGYTASVIAAQCGAKVIEKHFTAFPELDTPDAPHSLNPQQFKRMVDLIRGRDVESEEGAMFLRHNRRLIATRDIAPRETLTYGVNFGAYRALEDDTRGASPFDWEKVQGKVAKVAVARGKGLSLEDVE